MDIEGTRVEGEDFLYLVHDVGPHEPDGRYARMEFDLSLPLGRGADTPVVEKEGRHADLVLEWGRTAGAVLVRVEAARPCTIRLEGYAPWDWSGSWRAEEGRLHGTSGDGSVRVIVGSEPGPDAVVADTGSGEVRHDLRDRSTILYRIETLGAGEPADREGTAGSRTSASGRPGTADHRSDRGAPLDEVGHQLDEAAARYAAERVVTDGAWAGVPDAITNNLHWMVCVQPETGRLYTPAGRRWIFPHFEGGSQQWTIFEWDSFFNALELAVESPRLARSALDAVLETQYPSGCIPNWRGRFFGTPGRSQPPVGAFCVLRLYQRTGDRGMVEHAFPFLQRWSAWWYAERAGRSRRDGNGNGLFEWGTDRDVTPHSPAPWENEADGRQLAAWESGQDDLPNWDESGWSEATCTARLDAVDLNCYLALDHECLAALADVVGLGEVATEHRRRRDALSDRINDLLWDEDRGLYLDRHWNGRFSDRVASTNFLPLLAGVAPPERIDRMLDVLLDEGRFWGESVVPTISRDDPAFPDQQYWRGTIWPPTNYLLVHGLRRAGRDVEAAHLAARGVDLFMASWRAYRLCCENYDARTGAWGGRRYQSWGPLLALAGLEEYVDVTPWDGLRIGTLRPPGETRLHRIRIAGHDWSVRLSTAGLEVDRDGRRFLTSDRPIVVRQVVVADGRLTAHVTTERPCRVATPVEEVALSAGSHPVALRVWDDGNGGDDDPTVAP